ncbi:MAG: spondin domain-containing protein [Myxococcales bacterium]|nr:spondin domain-containing protein [Myxococcales bacterium]
MSTPAQSTTRVTAIVTICLGLIFSVGCSDDDDAFVVAQAPDDDGGPPDDDGGPPDDDGGPPGPSTFVLRIENVSDTGPLPGPISPGVALTHSESAPLFTVGMADRGEGLSAIAEDGDPTSLASTLSEALVFDTPVDAAEAGPALPGSAYELTFSAEPGESLSFATMLVQTNDVFLGPGEDGIPLFDDKDAPLAERDVTDLVSLWDVGSEANEPPGAGPNQAPRQAEPNTGASEGVVRRFTGSSHALPLPSALIGIDVTETDGAYTITLTNTAPTSGTLLSPFSPGVYVLHPSSVSLFEEGGTASAGLETLAEDGDPAGWLAELTQNLGDGSANTFGTEPVMGGDSVSFTVTPTPETPILSFATMVIATNDAFFALPPSGISLLSGDPAGPRAADEVAAELRSRIAIWDAGTEIDQIPGVGPDQPQRGGADVGAEDPDPTIRRAANATNIFANISDIIDVQVVNNAEDPAQFNVSIQVTPEGVANGFPILTPVAWAIHTSATALFTSGMPASAPLEALAEDGDPAMLATALQADPEVETSGVFGNAPFPPGELINFIVTPTMAFPILSFASMVVPSNDLFLAFGSAGISLLGPDGTPRPDADIATDIAANLAVWDAGTEQNESGAGGADQAPRGMPNTGEAEGNGQVRQLPDGVWVYPSATESVRVTIRPESDS